ncbi:MAG: hypothetical protein WCG50_13455 [Rhodoferax sp.]|uniref:hypothetical protein n=1 Tax=Rhodoferax sp. TaxID=50421 RepID=UPI003019F762
MFLRSLKLFIAALIAVLLAACGGGGSAAPAPTGLKVTPGEGYATVTWDMVPGVDYWLFYAPTSIAPADSSATQKWIGLLGGGWPMNVSSPYVTTVALANGISYSFTVNGRTDGGPGGPGATAVTTTPRLAGGLWTTGTAVVTTATPPTSPALRSVAFSTFYVAAGNGGAVFTSPDTVTWTAQPLAATAASGQNLNGASYFGNYKLVGDAGMVLTSPDAVTWTAQTSAATASTKSPSVIPSDLKAIASNNSNLNVAVGTGGTIITSSDGITWTAATSGTNNDLLAVTYSAFNVGANTAGTWIAVGKGGVMVQSADGLIWSTANSGTTADLSGVAYGVSSVTAAGVFVEVSTAGTVLSSANGTSWSTQILPATVTALNAITYGTQFVTVGAAGNIFTSTDGATWTLAQATSSSGVVSALSGSDLYAVARGSLAYAAVGASGTNLLSK